MKHTEYLYAVLQSLFDLQVLQVAKFQANLKNSPQSAKDPAYSTYLIEGYAIVYFKTPAKRH